MSDLRSQRQRNVQLITKINQVLDENSNVGIFNFDKLTMKQIETIRKSAYSHNVSMSVTKNTILKKCLKEKNNYILSNIQGKVFISFANNPASCVAFVHNIHKQVPNINPVCLINKSKNLLDSISFKSLAKMCNEQGIKISLVKIIKQIPTRLIKVLKLFSNKSN